MVERPERIVVPLDGSALAEVGVAYAAMVAAGLGARLVLFTAVGGEERQSFESYAAGEGISLDEAADAYLSRAARSLPPEANIDVETRFRLSDNPASAILDLITDVDASMIVMASHGRSGMTRWLLGSVADKVVQSSPVPVLVVPARER